MAEKLCVCAACHNRDAVWWCDVIIGGLHCANKKTREIRCVVSPMQMYQEGYFSVRKLVYWHDKIFILPTDLEKKWIVYDIATEKISYFHPVSFHYISEESVVIGSSLVCIPFFSNEPVLVIDLDTMQCIDKFDIWQRGKKPENIFEIWSASIAEAGISFLLRNSAYWCSIKGEKVQIVTLEISEPISCADICGSDGWALGMKGKTLYKFDEDGRCMAEIPIKVQREFVRLIATQRYIFLLPQEGSGLYVYDQYMQRFEIINSGMIENEHLFPGRLYVCSYWDYIIEGKTIHFMPCKYSYLSVDLETLECRQTDPDYPERFSKKCYWNYYLWIQELGQKKFREEVKDSLAGFLNMVIFSETGGAQDGIKKSKVWEFVSK
ncbi:hypothetical protein AALC75_08900 [Lachnospiraceae bacterium 48-42]|jgi:hypothetical protein